MENEFDRIMDFFSLSPEERETKLEGVFQDSVEYFEHFKHIMSNGSPEEKKQAVQNVMALKEKVEEETKEICEKVGMTEEELWQFSANSSNFTAEQWEMIEKAKQKLESGVEGIQGMVQDKTSGKEKQSEKNEVKPHHWIQP